MKVEITGDRFFSIESVPMRRNEKPILSVEKIWALTLPRFAMPLGGTTPWHLKTQPLLWLVGGRRKLVENIMSKFWMGHFSFSYSLKQCLTCSWNGVEVERQTLCPKVLSSNLDWLGRLSNLRLFPLFSKYWWRSWDFLVVQTAALYQAQIVKNVLLPVSAGLKL